jgi:hypothetical protein
MGAQLGLPEIRKLVARYLEDDMTKRVVECEGANLDEALKNAAIQLGCAVSQLEYTVLAQGTPGILGAGRKPCVISAGLAAQKRDASAEKVDLGDFDMGSEEDAKPIVKDRDGEVFVRLAPDGALLKVTTPVGKGRKANEKQAFDKLKSRAIHNFNENLVKQVVRDAEGDYVRVGEYIANPANDALMAVEVAEAEMKAYVIMSPPGPGGCDLSKDAILSVLKSNRVVYGVLPEALQEMEDNPRYKEPVLIAEGAKPVNGKDAFMRFNFETDKSKLHLREASDGRVDFKELNIIQNVIAGQPLARKVPAEIGASGKTVTGKILPAKNGKDMPIPLGKNVHVAEDGVTVVSDINGQVTYIGGKVNVEEVYVVQGDVSLKTGHIQFLGTVVVQGSVEDGFNVKASGNIEIRGNVGKCEIVAEGDIIVHQGVTGKGSGKLVAGKSVWAKFVENAIIEAGDNVIVSDGIVNSEVAVNKKIVCQGKRAAIVGGHYRACEEINAKTLGSPVGGAETIFEVGYDPKSKERLDQLNAQVNHIRRQVEEIDKNISTLNAIKKQKKILPEDKSAALEEFQRRREELNEEIAELLKEAQGVDEYLNGLKTRGRISASGKVFPGVKLVIKDAHEDVKNEMRAITFYLENHIIRTTKYEEVDDESIKRGPPDAYKTD